MRCLLMLLLVLGSTRALATSRAPQPDSFTVYFFLLEDCKITQAYTDKMAELHEIFANDSIGFVGMFPSPVSQDSTMHAFVEKYQIPFACTRTQAYTRAKALGVTVTPEVVLYNETRGQILYQGRIDNMFERVGLRRQVVSSHELQAALYCLTHQKPIPIAKTTPIGCFLK